MNLFNAVRHAERAVADGREEEAVSLLRLADAILDDAPAERNDIVARCCRFRLPDGRVHCGTVRDDGLVEEMLFPGTPEERKALCHTCAVELRGTCRGAPDEAGGHRGHMSAQHDRCALILFLERVHVPGLGLSSEKIFSTIRKMLPDYLFSGRATEFTDVRDRRLRRALEILPGALTWMTLSTVLIGSFVFPQGVALFILAFDLYWIVNSVYFVVFIVRSTKRMRASMREDWMAKLHALPVEQYRVSVKHVDEIVHLVIFPMFRESEEIVGAALEALHVSTYPNEKFWVVLATEARAGEEAQRTASALRARFADRFGRFLLTTHPDDTEGEVAGKGSNQTYATRRALKELIDPAGIPYEHVLVSVFDSDTRVYPEYFACLTYHYLTAEKPLRSSYQPIPLYNNNIWEAPLFSRIPAIGSSTWQLFMQSQPNLQETFSSHSMSLKTLVDVGLWNTRLVSEDSLIFWQCYLAFDGDYRVVSLFYPVSMDANVGRTWWRTVSSVYRQHRRWAYGIEKIAYVLFGFVKNPRISLHKKLWRSWRLILGFWMWACAPLLLMSLGWLPVLVGGEEFRQTVLAFNLPRWTRNLMTVAAVGLVINGALTFLLLPPRPKGTSRMAYVGIVIQWLFLPLSTVLFGSFPAIDAQTRMMRGKYLGFWVTEKIRKQKT